MKNSILNLQPLQKNHLWVLLVSNYNFVTWLNRFYYWCYQNSRRIKCL